VIFVEPRPVMLEGVQAGRGEDADLAMPPPYISCGSGGSGG